MKKALMKKFLEHMNKHLIFPLKIMMKNLMKMMRPFKHPFLLHVKTRVS
jgi:hypothetical protein